MVDVSLLDSGTLVVGSDRWSYSEGHPVLYAADGKTVVALCTRESGGYRGWIVEAGPMGTQRMRATDTVPQRDLRHGGHGGAAAGAGGCTAMSDDGYRDLPPADARRYISRLFSPLSEQLCDEEWAEELAVLNLVYRLGQQHERARPRCCLCSAPATTEWPAALRLLSGEMRPVPLCGYCYEHAASRAMVPG